MAVPIVCLMLLAGVSGGAAAREAEAAEELARELLAHYAAPGDSLRRRAAELSRTATTALSRLRRKTAAREQELLATEKREDYRRRGDLITANIYRLSRGMDSFEAVDYYDESCPTVTVALDPRKTPQQNAAAS